MATYSVTLSVKQWADYHNRLAKSFVPTIMRGMHRGALQSVAGLQRATNFAPSSSEHKQFTGAVNTGAYKRAWKWGQLPDGVMVYNQMPYAGVIEGGRRKGARMPPKDAIARWAQRKLSLSEHDAKRAAFAIARAIQKKGLRPRHVMLDRIPDMVSAMNDGILKELDRELSR